VETLSSQSLQKKTETMAMIEQIRNRQGLLLVIIGIGMLGFLVPYDAVLALMGQGTTRDVGGFDRQHLAG
jgi:hypothetical protein